MLTKNEHCLRCTTDRHPGCHSHCEKYLEWKEVHDGELEEYRKARKGQIDAYAAKIEGIRRMRKKRRKK